jgi:hypothetical protein
VQPIMKKAAPMAMLMTITDRKTRLIMAISWGWWPLGKRPRLQLEHPEKGGAYPIILSVIRCVPILFLT